MCVLIFGAVAPSTHAYVYGHHGYGNRPVQQYQYPYDYQYQYNYQNYDYRDFSYRPNYGYSGIQTIVTRPSYTPSYVSYTNSRIVYGTYFPIYYR
jgi:hypothetical protein